MSTERLGSIVTKSVSTLFRQIDGGRVRCESEATMQLHLGRIIASVADLELVNERETFSIELEKPLRGENGKRARLDVWFKLTDEDGRAWRCAIELKFFKRANHREPNNRYDVFENIARLESCGDVADLGFVLVATDHPHYVMHEGYSADTAGFDFRDGAAYAAGTVLTYHTGRYGPPLTLARDYRFGWVAGGKSLYHLLLQVVPILSAA